MKNKEDRKEKKEIVNENEVGQGQGQGQRERQRVRGRYERETILHWCVHIFCYNVLYSIDDIALA